jgi:hypothetical protein
MEKKQEYSIQIFLSQMYKHLYAIFIVLSKARKERLWISRICLIGLEGKKN